MSEPDVIHYCDCCSLGYRYKPGLSDKLCPDCYHAGCMPDSSLPCRLGTSTGQAREQHRLHVGTLGSEAQRDWQGEWQRAIRANWEAEHQG